MGKLQAQKEMLNALAAVPEPPPIVNDGESMHDLVIVDLHERKEFGLQKYGTLLQAGNGRRPLVDAYQEVLDLAVYLRQEITERERLQARIVELEELAKSNL